MNNAIMYFKIILLKGDVSGYVMFTSVQVRITYIMLMVWGNWFTKHFISKFEIP